jgi:maltose O-acetyltransferase
MDRAASLHSLLGAIGEGLQLRFACDYRVNIRIGQNSFINFGCVFLDCNSIIVGQDAQIGPAYAFTRPCIQQIRTPGARDWHRQSH